MAKAKLFSGHMNKLQILGYSVIYRAEILGTTLRMFEKLKERAGEAGGHPINLSDYLQVVKRTMRRHNWCRNTRERGG